ncbi:MAG: family 43 glycosylhydrolase [Bacteroidaceae bacterium]|nr:family 43 glycosylhydrolase [Bacteroidaceae bacterium]
MKRLILALLCAAFQFSSFICQFSPAVAQPKPFAGYLFAYFEGGGDKNLQEQLRFAVSEDAVNWYALNDNRPIVASDSISESGGIRDPHILRGEDGDYYIVATDMMVAKNGWNENPGIVLMKSHDLVNWTHAKINLGRDWPAFADAYWVWAPQTIYDRRAKKYMIYFTLQRTSDGRKSLITYYAYANRDFTAFESEPKQLFAAKYGSIDNDIIEDEKGTYHLFYKGNTKGADGKEVKNGIQRATAKRLTGPWKEDFQYLDAYAGTKTHVEGSSVFKTQVAPHSAPEGATAHLSTASKAKEAPSGAVGGACTWVLMYDLYSSGRYEYQTSKDLKTWTKEPLSFRKNFFPRHGSVISVTQEELERVQQKWGWVLTHEFESNGNPIIRDKHTADPAVLVEGDTLWLFAGHDAAGNQSKYIMKDWLLYSTTDMKHWTEYPSPLHIDDFKWASSHQAYAGHVAKGKDGRYYWYVSTNWCGIGVAVSDKITGPYKDALGKPLLTKEDCFASKHSWAVIDPAILIDDDGTPYIIWGNGQCYYAKLKDNMIEIDGPIHQIALESPSLGEGSGVGHPFTEAPWVHKYNGKYYLTYASEWPEKIAYAIADHIGGPYTPMGIISEIAGNSNTTHPAIVQFRDQWIFFSHNGGLPDGTGYSRSVIAEPLHYNADGSIRRIPATAEGVDMTISSLR